MQKISFVALAAIMLTSCSIDITHPDMKDSTRDWRDVLSKIKTDNQLLFSENELSIVSYSPVNEYIDKTAILQEGFFPAFHGNRAIFDIMPYEFLVNDTTVAHVNFSRIDSIANEVTDPKNDYLPVKINWKKKDHEFSTIALFDKQTGELIYDDILYNVILISQTDAESLTSLLTSAEFDTSTDSGSDFVNLYDSGVKVATASVSWAEYGYWSSTKSTYGDYYKVSYRYCHERLESNTLSWIIDDRNYPATNYSSISNFIKLVDDYSNTNFYRFRYELLVSKGATNTLFSALGDNYDSNETNVKIKVRTIAGSPSRPDEIVAF